MKQGNEEFKFIKNPENKELRNYIFQKNSKTKTAFYFVASVLVMLITALFVTAFAF